MFDIGFWELVILFGLGLMVLGPERMPQVAAKLGRWAGQARNMARHLSNQMREEIEPLQKSMDPLQKSMDDLQQGLEKDLNQTIGANTDWSARRPEPGQAPADTAADSETDTTGTDTSGTDIDEPRPGSEP